MLVQAILDRAGELLVDQTHVTWPLANLLAAYNEAILTILNYRPELYTRQNGLVCNKGTLQSLPDDAIRLVNVVRNHNGPGITELSKELLDSMEWNWMESLRYSTESIQNWVYDERNLKQFYVYPGAQQGDAIVIEYTTLPVTVQVEDLPANPTDNWLGAQLPLEGTLLNPILNFIQFRCYSQDDTPAFQAKAASCLKLFAQELGIKLNAEVFLSESKSKGHANGQHQ